jgi:hypothetical protein
MLRGVSDHQRASSAQTGGDSDDDRGRGSGWAAWLDPSPPVLAFGCQNVIALLVELRRRERLTVRRCRARVAPEHWPLTGEDPDLAARPPLRPPLSATDCKEQP